MKPTFLVGSLPVYGDLILSPMDGLSGLPFRSLAREMGSAMSYTEFIGAIDVINRHPYLEEHLVFIETERPVVYQLMDNDPGRLLQAAIRLRQRNPDVIDINMGCCARSVSARGAGAGLMRSPQTVARMVSELSRALDIPVTAKIRLGWDDDNRNYLEIAHIIEDNGGKLIAIHGRTRRQGYGGAADWDAIAEVKQAVSIPVIGNGDVRCVADIERLKAHTGCDAVMIGRAALGNPWIFSRLDRSQVSTDQVFITIQDHLHRMLAFYGQERGLVLFRKYAIHYLKPYHINQHQRLALLSCTSPTEFMDLLRSIFKQFESTGESLLPSLIKGGIGESTYPSSTLEERRDVLA